MSEFKITFWVRFKGDDSKPGDPETLPISLLCRSEDEAKTVKEVLIRNGSTRVDLDSSPQSEDS